MKEANLITDQTPNIDVLESGSDEKLIGGSQRRVGLVGWFLKLFGDKKQD